MKKPISQACASTAGRVRQPRRESVPPENDKDAAEYYERLQRISPVSALQLRLMNAFKLRMKEVLMLRPVESDQGSHLHVHRGTKGGVQRQIPIDSHEQRHLLDQAKAVADDSGHVRARPGMTLQQAVRHFKYLLWRAGAKPRTSGGSNPDIDRDGGGGGGPNVPTNFPPVGRTALL